MLRCPQAARFTGLRQPPSLRQGPSPRRADPPAPHDVVQSPCPSADGAVSADMFLLVAFCFVKAGHCGPPLETEWTMIDNGDLGDTGDGGQHMEAEGIGFGPEDLGEVDRLSRLTAAIYRCVFVCWFVFSRLRCVCLVFSFAKCQKVRCFPITVFLVVFPFCHCDRCWLRRGSNAEKKRNK